MTDTVLIQNGAAHEIWPNATKESLAVFFAPALVEQMVEVVSGSVNPGDLWDGTAFTPAPPPPVPDNIVSYDTFRQRWTDGEKAALHGALQASWQIDDFVGLARAQNSINLSRPTAGQAKAAFVAAGVLTQERADEIFS